jgi:hypothetical protein
LLWVEAASATPLAGDVKLFGPVGNNVIGQPMLTTGDLDSTSNTMSVDPFIVLGSLWATQSIELQDAGPYARPDGVGGSISVMVNPR